MSAALVSQSRWQRWRRHPLARVGPGLITGVADDDPGGIATYSQAGAQFGLQLLWTMPFAFPLMAAMQSLCARIGRVTGQGIAANIRQHCPAFVLFGVVGLLLIANTLNLAADVAAMGEAAALVSGFDRHLLTALFVLSSVLLQVFVPYHRYVKFLKWLTLSLLAYAGVLFTVEVPWGAVLTHSLWPHLAWNRDALAMVVALLGTTISPYLFFWQASEEVEDLRRRADSRTLLEAPEAGPVELRRIAWDTWSGMFYSNVTAWLVILVTAVTLHAAGVTAVSSAAQAAEALRPLAGEFAFVLFALGIVGVGLIGVPVLAGSAAYAVAEAFGWRVGLECSPGEAPGFYAVLAASMLVGLGAQYLPVAPLTALFYSAVINGVVAVPLMVVILLLARRPAVMGRFVAGPASLGLGWLATGAMGCAAVLMFVLA